MAVAVEGAPRYRPSSCSDEALRVARTCYDHLAGRLGVALADTLLSRGHIVLDEDAGKLPLMEGGFMTNSVLILRVRRTVGGVFAGHVWIGVSGGGTWEVRSGRHWLDAALTWVDRACERQPRRDDHRLRAYWIARDLLNRDFKRPKSYRHRGVTFRRGIVAGATI